MKTVQLITQFPIRLQSALSLNFLYLHFYFLGKFVDEFNAATTMTINEHQATTLGLCLEERYPGGNLIISSVLRSS